MVAYDIKIRHRALLPGLLWGLFCVAPISAEEVADEQPRWYQVELIVFAHRNDEAFDSERWPEIAGVSLPENLRQLELPFTPAPTPPTPPTDTPVAAPIAAPEPAATPSTPEPFLILGDEDMQLNDMAKRLARSKNYEPLLHVAWRQPTLADDQAQSILIYDGMTTPYSEAELAALQAQATENTEKTESTEPSIQTPAEAEQFPAETLPVQEDDGEMGPPAHKLIGTVRLSVARYLHLDADLLYRIPIPQKAAVPVPDLDLWYDRPYPTLHDPQGPAYRVEEWQALRGFRLLESRRMRSKEIHYLDNPFFGVVVLVTPYELPVPEPVETPVEADIKKPASNVK